LGRAFANTEDDTVLNAFENEGFLQLELSYFF